jgi:YVTN family beta-propeller protein
MQTTPCRRCGEPSRTGHVDSTRMSGRRVATIALIGLLLAACGSSEAASTATATGSHSAATIVPTPSHASATAAATPSATAKAPSGPANVYAFTLDGTLSAKLAGLPPRVYVPDENSNDVVVIDPRTFKIIGRFDVGLAPEHITPDWDLGRLYVNNMNGSSLTVIDMKTNRPIKTIKVPFPYNLYFTPDGSKAIVVDDYMSSYWANKNGLYFYDRKTWKLIKFVQIPWSGADHLDFSADGTFLLVSCETSGIAAKVDLRSLKVTGKATVGGLPLDVRLSPNGKVFYVANQGLGGVNVVDAATLKVTGFIKTGTGAHGLGLSRDTKTLYVTNRIAGTISLIDVATNKVKATWDVGGSPDMVAISVDGTQMWVSNRYHGTVDVINTATGRIIRTIATGANPHGLVYWPQPGRYSLGHNGNMR